MRSAFEAGASPAMYVRCPQYSHIIGSAGCPEARWSHPGLTWCSQLNSLSSPVCIIRRNPFRKARIHRANPAKTKTSGFIHKVCNSTHFKSEIAKVASELDTIHSANMRYWTCGAAASSEKRAAYQRMLGRGKIRAALAEPLLGVTPFN